MSKIWIFVLCAVLNSITVAPTPKIPVSKWPYLIQSPTVPRLEDLKLAIRDLTSKPRTVSDLADLFEANPDENNDVNDCEKCVVELDAEELKSPKNDTSYDNEATLQGNENYNQTEVEIKDKNINKKLTENYNATDNIKPLPTFIPIFRKRKPKRIKSSSPVELKKVEVKNEIATTIDTNIKHDNDVVVNYIKNEDNRPILNIIGPQKAINKGVIRIIPVNPMFSNGFSYSQLSNEEPNKNEDLKSTVPRDTPKNTVQENVLPIDTVTKTNYPANIEVINSISTNTNPRNTLILNTIASNPKYVNTSPADAVNNINTIPTDIISTNINPGVVTDVKYSGPENDISIKPVSQNDVRMNTINTDIPANIDLENTIPLNISPKHFISDSRTPPVNNANAVRIKMIPANTIFSNPVQKDTVPINIIPKNNAPVNTAPENVFHIITIPTNAASTTENISKHTVAMNTATSKNTIPANSIIIKTVPTANAITNTVPSTIAPKNAMHLDKLPTILTNGIALDAAPRYADTSNTLPVSNTNPLNMFPSVGCNECSDNAQKADFVLFKPEDVSVLNVCGDILKKVTMTVLVPMYVSKLDF